MTKPKTIDIKGKPYVTVAERVRVAHEDLKDNFSITTEILYTDPDIVIKATVTTPKGTFTGISYANPAKTIEKMSPYEVAETSAVGRALGFAGYGAVDSIATADEMTKASVMTPARKNCEYCGTTNQYHKKGCPNNVDIDVTQVQSPFDVMAKKEISRIEDRYIDTREE